MMNVKAPANKCVRRGCKRTVTTVGYTRSKYPKGSTLSVKGYSNSLCGICRKDIFVKRQELILTCYICNKSIFIRKITSKIKNTCSDTCAKKRHAILAKDKWRSLHPNFNEHCKTCKNKFTEKQMQHRRTYCSPNCYPCKIPLIRERNRKVKRMYIKHLRLIKQNLYYLFNQ